MRLIESERDEIKAEGRRKRLTEGERERKTCFIRQVKITLLVLVAEGKVL